VRTDYFTPGDEDGDFFLVVSRLVGYKRIDLAIEAFNELGMPLVVIGDGPERKKLEDAAKDNIRFLGRQPDDVVRDHMRKCKALIFPGEEDFGITPVEVQACGRPVIAFARGGVLETVMPGVTGIFFDSQHVNSLIGAIKSLNYTSESDIMTNAAKFSMESFTESVKQYVLSMV
jgi:glycosyltransferase involved in cell wall biosynthesis